MNVLHTHDGLKLHVHVWPSAADDPVGTMVLIHGLGEHAGRYGQVAARCNSWGYDVISMDHRGHGRSEGARGDGVMEDFLQDVAALIDHAASLGLSSNITMLGHSLGGLIAARFAIETDQAWTRPLQRLILSSPALDPGVTWVQKILMATVGKLVPRLAVSSGLDAQLVCSNAQVVQSYLSDPLIHNKITGRMGQMVVDEGRVVIAAAAHWRLPTLLVYSSIDKIVDPQGSVRFAQHAPQDVVRTHAYALHHEILFASECEPVWADVQAWLQQQSATT